MVTTPSPSPTPLAPTPATQALREPVSVCLASFNGEKYIHAQVASVLDQLQAEDELIVSDDGSRDQTLSIVAAFNDPRIRILRNPTPLGVVRNFEQALRTARHNILFLCDQDDIWLPGKVDRCASVLQTAMLVVTDCAVVDGQLQPLQPSFFAMHGSRTGMLPNLWRNAYLGCCMAFRRAVVERALPMPKKVPMHDMWLGLVAETLGQVVFLPEVLSQYRRHAQANSDAAGTSSSTRWQQLSYRWQLVKGLFLRTVFKR